MSQDQPAADAGVAAVLQEGAGRGEQTGQLGGAVLVLLVHGTGQGIDTPQDRLGREVLLVPEGALLHHTRLVVDGDTRPHLGGGLCKEAQHIVRDDGEAPDDILPSPYVRRMNGGCDRFRPRLGLFACGRRQVQVFEHQRALAAVDRILRYQGRPLRNGGGRRGCHQPRHRPVPRIAGEDEGGGDVAQDAGQGAHRQRQQMAVADGECAGEGILIAADLGRTEQRPHQLCVIPVAIGLLRHLLAQDAAERGARHQGQVGGAGAGDGQIDHAGGLPGPAVQDRQGVKMKKSWLHAVLP
jgi:hypothetical protein